MFFFLILVIFSCFHYCSSNNIFNSHLPQVILVPRYLETQQYRAHPVRTVRDRNHPVRRVLQGCTVLQRTQTPHCPVLLGRIQPEGWPYVRYVRPDRSAGKMQTNLSEHYLYEILTHLIHIYCEF